MSTYIKTGFWETLKTTAPKNWLNLTKLINDIVDSNYKPSILGSLKITDSAPTAQCLYILSDAGTYTNLGGLVATADKLNYAYFDGTTWKLIAVDVPISATVVDGLATKLDKGTYTGTASDLKSDIDGKANSVDVSAVLALKADKSTTYTKSEVDTKLEEAIYYSIIY